MLTFPVTIAYGATGGPEFKTNVFTADSGYEQRNSVWANARYHADVSTGLQTQDDLNQLIAFFRVMHGRAYTFRFRDWSDYTIELGTLGVGNGVATTFQLVKKYIIGTEEITRVVKYPVLGTLSNLRVDGAVVSNYTLDYDTGVITFSAPLDVGAVLTVDYIEYDLRCRFDTDHLQIKLEAYKLGSWDSIPIVEV